jgi:hypothetical protein
MNDDPWWFKLFVLCSIVIGVAFAVASMWLMIAVIVWVAHK